MKLRYYLRGLGIGILVTALVLTIVPGEKEVLSDAEIRERALQLGMVDSSSLTLADMQVTVADTQETNEKTNSEKSEEVKSGEVKVEEVKSDDVKSDEVKTEEAKTEEVKSDEVKVGEAKPEEEKSEDVNVAETKSEDANAGNENLNSEKVAKETATITIKSGDSSYTVAKTLQEAGLIVDAGAFDTYLCDNGYSRSIGTGIYEIVFGTTEEEIAKIISGKR